MKTQHLSPKTMPEEARRIFRLAFPSYTGRQYRIQSSDTVNMASYWEGGSRDYFVVVRIDGSTLTIPQQSAFDKEVAGATSFSIPEGFAVVEHSIFCGKDMGLTIHVPASRFAQLLPETFLDLSPEQRKVLDITASKKPSYRRTEAARHGITADQWETLVATLVDLKLLRRNGSITIEGRNHR